MGGGGGGSTTPGLGVAATRTPLQVEAGGGAGADSWGALATATHVADRVTQPLRLRNVVGQLQAWGGGHSGGHGGNNNAEVWGLQLHVGHVVPLLFTVTNHTSQALHVCWHAAVTPRLPGGDCGGLLLLGATGPVHVALAPGATHVHAVQAVAVQPGWYHVALGAVTAAAVLVNSTAGSDSLQAALEAGQLTHVQPLGPVYTSCDKLCVLALLPDAASSV